MRFDARFVYWQFVGRMGRALRGAELEEGQGEEGA